MRNLPGLKPEWTYRRHSEGLQDGTGSGEMMKFESVVSKRQFMRLGTAIAASGPLAALYGARANEPDPSQDLSARRSQLPRDIVYVQSNITVAGSNSILAYRRADDGSLTPLPNGPFPTGGTGFLVDDILSGPLAWDQQIAIDRLRGVLYTVNSGSNSVAAMQIAPDGSLAHLPGSPFATPGTTPASIGLRPNSLVVVNSDSSVAQPAGPTPSLSLFSIDLEGGLRDIPSAQIAISNGADPTQALTTNTGPFTFVCDMAGGTISSYLLAASGSDSLSRLIDTQTPPQQAGATAVPIPLGLWAHPRAPVLYVGFASTQQVGVYRWDATGRLTFLRTATNSGKAICWLRTAYNGRWLYTVNTADDSISVYDTNHPERPVEIQHLTIVGGGILVQFGISPDQKFLYALALGATDTGPNPALFTQNSRLHVFAIDPTSGRVSEVVSAMTTIDLPTNTIPQGVAIL